MIPVPRKSVLKRKRSGHSPWGAVSLGSPEEPCAGSAPGPADMGGPGSASKSFLLTAGQEEWAWKWKWFVLHLTLIDFVGSRFL